MFKKTLLAASLVAATASTAFAGDITVFGTAYKVGNEYLSAYTGTALTGDLDAASIAITYNAGIALGVDNTLKFVFAGGAISADTGLKLEKAVFNAANHADMGALNTAIEAATLVVQTAGTLGSDALDTAAMKAAATKVITDAEALDPTLNGDVAKAAIAGTAVLALAASKTAIDALDSDMDTWVGSNTADLVDFGVDGNGDYEWVLFKLTGATLVADVLWFNDTDDNGGADVTTTFTKATIGAGDLTVAMTEAKDGTGADLAAPVATAKTLVTTADQFAVELTVAEDTIDVEQDRLYFSDGATDDLTSDFTFDVTVDATIDLGITVATADFVGEIAGTTTGIDSIDYVETDVVGGDDSGAFDVDNLLAGTGISDATISITVDGETNLATRTLTYALEITPAEADTDAFTLVTASNAFVWDLNGSQITFPYAPIGYDHITTNFELANSGDQEGDVLITAFTREGVSYSGTLAAKATAESLTKVSESEVYDALGLAAGTSLSITFSTTAPAAEIKMTGYSNLTSGGRMTLLSDAYEGM